MREKGWQKSIQDRKKHCKRENLSSNPCLEIVLRTLWVYKWEDSIKVVITDNTWGEKQRKTASGYIV